MTLRIVTLLVYKLTGSLGAIVACEGWGKCEGIAEQICDPVINLDKHDTKNSQ